MSNQPLQPVDYFIQGVLVGHSKGSERSFKTSLRELRALTWMKDIQIIASLKKLQNHLFLVVIFFEDDVFLQVSAFQPESGKEAA